MKNNNTTAGGKDLQSTVLGLDQSEIVELCILIKSCGNHKQDHDHNTTAD